MSGFRHPESKLSEQQIVSIRSCQDDHEQTEAGIRAGERQPAEKKTLKSDEKIRPLRVSHNVAESCWNNPENQTCQLHWDAAPRALLMGPLDHSCQVRGNFSLISSSSFSQCRFLNEVSRWWREKARVLRNCLSLSISPPQSLTIEQYPIIRRTTPPITASCTLGLSFWE